MRILLVVASLITLTRLVFAQSEASPEHAPKLHEILEDESQQQPKTKNAQYRKDKKSIGQSDSTQSKFDPSEESSLTNPSQDAGTAQKR